MADQDGLLLELLDLVGDAFFNGVGKLLSQQLARSTPLEQAILYWLAIERELVPVSALLADLGEGVSQRELLVALESLRHRMLIERAPDRPAFTLQPVILEYVTDQLVGAIHQEFVDGQPATGGILQSIAAKSHPADDAQRTSGEQRVAIGLPFQPTLFIGRGTEVTEIARLLSDPACRLLTLLGPGGIGKTRLALEVAASQSDAFADGVAFVGLASIGTPNQIVSAIGDTLSLSFAGQPDATAHLLGYLRDRHMLLLLDNFEHLLAGADLVNDILTRAPRITILITSRERLNLQAEWLFDVDGLAYPPEDPHGSVAPQSLADVTGYSAVQLFIQRATQVQSGLPLPESTLATIVRICQHGAGMPLAIELAAAGVHTLPIAEIERQIRSNLDVLTTTLRDVPARHRSMRAVFDHSWNLLSEPERALLSRLAVFRGGWMAEAAEAVCTQAQRQKVKGANEDGAAPLLPFTSSLLPVLTALVDKSLVREGSAAARSSAEPNAAAEPRFVLLEPIREYALERLANTPDAETIRRRHAHYFTALAEAAAAEWGMAKEDSAIAKLDGEHDNLRAALQWACESGDGMVGLELAEAVWRFWRSYGYTSEGRVWLEQLLTLEDDPADVAAMAARRRGLHAAAWLASDQHDFATAARLFEQSMALRRALGETEGEMDLLLNAARQARAVGQYQRAMALLEDALSRYRALGDRTTMDSAGLGSSSDEFGQVLRELGLVLREQGDFVRAAALFEEGLKLHRATGNRAGVAFALLGLGDVARDQGDAAGVRKYCEQSLAILRELGMQWAIGFALNSLALGAYHEGDLTRAFALADESVALFRGLRADASIAEVLITLGQIARGQGNAAAAYEALTEALPLAQAVGPHLLVAAALEGLAGLASQPSQAALAVQLIGAASALRAQMGAAVRPVDRPAVEDALATARSALAADAFAAVWTEARELPLEQVLSAIPSAASFDALPLTLTIQR